MNPGGATWSPGGSWAPQPGPTLNPAIGKGCGKGGPWLDADLLVPKFGRPVPVRPNGGSFKPAGAPGTGFEAGSRVDFGHDPGTMEVPHLTIGRLITTNPALLQKVELVSGASCAVLPHVAGTEKDTVKLSGTPQQVAKAREAVLSIGKPGSGFLNELPTVAPGGPAALVRPPNPRPLGGLPLGLGGSSPLIARPLGTNRQAITPAVAANALGGLPGVDMSKLNTLLSAMGPEASGYYAQILSNATLTREDPVAHVETVKPQDFDREALRRLAKQAEEDSADPISVAGNVAHDIKDRTGDASVVGFAASLEYPGSLGSALNSPVAAKASAKVVSSSASVAPTPVSPKKQDNSPVSDYLPPPGKRQRTAEVSKKDSTSVLKFLQDAQENVTRSRAQRLEPGKPSTVGATTTALAAIGGTPSGGPLQALFERIQAGVEPDCRHEVSKEVIGILPSLEPRQATDLVSRVHAADGLEHAGLLDDLCKALAVSIPRFRSSDLGKLTEIFAKWSSTVHDDRQNCTSEPVRGFFHGIQSEITLRLMDIAPSDLARIAAVLADIGAGGTYFFASVARAAGARIDRFVPSELVALMKAFGKEGCFQTFLYEGLARCIRVNVKDVPPADVLCGMLSLAECGVRDEGLADALGDHLPKAVISAGAYTAEESCKLAWAFCVLGLHHDELFRSVFAVLENSPLEKEETLCQLYEIHLTLVGFHAPSYKAYELGDDTVRSLRRHYRRSHAGQRVKPARASERLHSDVADTVKQVLDASAQVGYTTSFGFMVDVAALPRSKRSSSSSSSEPLVVFEIEGPHTLIRSLDPAENTRTGAPPRVRGDVLMKRRLLERCGLKVIVFTEDKWRGLDGGSDRRKFLRGRLRDAGFSADKLS